MNVHGDGSGFPVQRACAVAAQDRPADYGEEFCADRTPNGNRRVLLGGGKPAVMIEEIPPQADDKTAELQSSKARMEMDALGETLVAKEGSG